MDSKMVKHKITVGMGGWSDFYGNYEYHLWVYVDGRMAYTETMSGTYAEAKSRVSQLRSEARSKRDELIREFGM